VLPVNVKGIMGTVTLGGADTTDEICGGVRNSKIGDCVQTKRTFTNATAHAASPRSGVLTLNRIANVRLAVADCPHEPPDVIRQPLGPPLDLVRLPKAALLQRRFGRITLRASRTQRKVYGSPEEGRLEATVEWTLTFIRVGK
jgi:hypothetical protein